MQTQNDTNDGGYTCVCEFVRSGAIERTVMRRAPNRQDALDCGCQRKAQRVRLVRHVLPKGERRVLMTNLFNNKLFPADCFGKLHHKRRGIEEAFKRLKHRLNLEHVTGLGQQAVVQDVAAKIVCDNLQFLVSMTARPDAYLFKNKRIDQGLRPHRAQAADAKIFAWWENRQKGWDAAARPACTSCSVSSIVSTRV